MYDSLISTLRRIADPIGSVCGRIRIVPGEAANDDAEFESKHPRNHGKFASKGTATSVSEAEEGEYRDAILNGDDDRAFGILRDVASRAMPDTKVVDSDGKPKVVYHHTENRFTKFDLANARQSMDVHGIFFYDDPNAGEEYGSVTYPVFLNIKNPYVIDSAEKMRALEWDGSRTGEGVRVREMLQEKGYDGILRTKEFMGDAADEWIAFSPNQIKSAEIETSRDEYGEDPVPLDRRFDDGDDIRGAV